MLRQFVRYVSLNIMGMMGISFYVLADTYFIANGLGANGLTALNHSGDFVWNNWSVAGVCSCGSNDDDSGIGVCGANKKVVVYYCFPV